MDELRFVNTKVVQQFTGSLDQIQQKMQHMMTVEQMTLL